MPAIDQLRELEKLLAEATEPSTDLVFKVGEAFVPREKWGEDYWITWGRWVRLEAYTEAALALVEQVLPGYKMAMSNGRREEWAAYVWKPSPISRGQPSPQNFYAHHPALAILRALVAALIQQQETENECA